MAGDISTWTPGKVCGALKALFDARCFGPRTRDNVIMYDLGRYLAKHGHLSPRQIDVVRAKLPKYTATLSRLNVDEVPVVLPDGGDKYRFDVHNPKTLRVYAPRRSPILLNIRRIHGFSEHPDGYFLVPFSPRNIYVLRHNGFVEGPRVGEVLNRPAQPLLEPDFSHLLIKPKDYQREGVKLLLARGGRAILADEQGLGKTGQAIAWAQLAEIPKICVVCPASLKAVWHREINKWTGSTDICLLSGRSVHVEGEQAMLCCRWVVINYDILAAWRTVLGHAGFGVVIFDEAQALKNARTKRTKAAEQLVKHMPHVLMLSGTPCENRPAEFWSIIQMVDPLLFPSKIKYQVRYCDLHDNPAGYPDDSGASNTQELHKILTDTIMVRRKKADVLAELPEKQRAVVPFRLSSSALRNYRYAERDFRAWLVENSAGLSAKKLQKKLQAQALLKLGVLKRMAAVAKVPMVVDWVRTYLENESKLVLFAEQHEVIDALKAEFRQHAVVVDGRVSANKRQALCDAFQNDKNVHLFIGGLRAAGTGLTLTAAKDTATVEFGWTSTIHDQCEDRVHRIGQKNSVMAYYLLAEGTVEESIVALLDQKRAVISQIMDGDEPVDSDLLDELLKQYWSETDGDGAD